MEEAWLAEYYGGYYGSYWYPGYYGFGFGYYDPWFYNSSFYNSSFYDYPYGYGGYGYSSYSYPYASAYSYAPNVAPVAGGDYEYDDRPQVVVNQRFVNPNDRCEPDRPYEYDSNRAPNDATDYKPTLYLIALRDHNILASFTYWVEGGMLHYVTEDHAMREVPLSDVDRELSERLNRERNMNFRLPAGR